MKIDKYKDMHVEKYLFEIIKDYKKTEIIKICSKRCKNAYRKISEILMF